MVGMSRELLDAFGVQRRQRQQAAAVDVALDRGNHQEHGIEPPGKQLDDGLRGDVEGHVRNVDAGLLFQDFQHEMHLAPDALHAE